MSGRETLISPVAVAMALRWGLLSRGESLTETSTSPTRTLDVRPDKWMD